MRTLWLGWVCAAVALAQADVYPFAIDQDALTGAPDFSFLNRPLEAADKIVVVNGRFHRIGPDLQARTADDERVFFYGVNLAFAANFPTEADAPRIAKRLRKLGVNLVRLHHMDTQPDRAPSNAGSILTDGPYPTLNPVAVSRLRAFLDAMAAEGIYVNLNLSVGYVFRPAIDGIPVLDNMPTQSKPVRLMHPKMIALQAKFTREVIRALELRDDPVLAMVEISNETSLVYHWQTNTLERYMQPGYAEPFETEWNGFLARRYATTDDLRSAWGATEPDGDNILAGQWRLENQARVPVTMQQDTAEVRVEAPPASSPIILKLVGFSVAAADTYVAEVDLRVDVAAGHTRTVYWDVKQDVSPWRSVLGQNVAVSNEWRTFRMRFQPAFDMNAVGRFGLSIERAAAPLYIRNWRLYRAGRRGLSEGESLEERNVPLVLTQDGGNAERTNDVLRFLADRDKAYLEGMLAAVRQSVAWNVPVAGTQIGFGGMLNYDSHAHLDYQDNHYYVDHYNFPNVSWDGRDWRMRNLSNIGAGAEAFARMAATRQIGRPFTVSEFNQPWPNTYAAEADATLAVFARFQDWDSIMHFAYSHGRGWDDGVPNGFNLNGDWTKFPNFGQSAWLFRSGAIRSGSDAVAIPISESQRLQATRERRNGNVHQFLTSAIGYDPNLAFVQPVGIAVDATEPLPAAVATKVEPPFQSATGDFTYDRTNKLWLIHAPQAAGVFGFAGALSITSGAIEVKLAESARGFVSLLLTALDGKPLTESGRMLLSNPGLSLRTQPSSSPPRPQAVTTYTGTSDWYTLEPEPDTGKPSGHLNTGRHPTYMERIELHLTLRTDASALRVYRLGGAGERLGSLEDEFVQRTPEGFRIHFQAAGQQPAPWYEIVAER